MARRPRSRYRWPIALTEAVLFQAMLTLGSVVAADASAGSATAVIAAGFESADPSEQVATGNGSDLYLDVIVNGAAKGLEHFALRDGEIYASSATLRKLGFALAADVTEPVRVSSIPGVRAQYDATRQSLTIDAPLKLLSLPSTVLNAPENTVPKVTTAPGLLLNYDLYSTVGEHDTQSLNTFTELRAFNDLGLLSTTALSQVNHAGPSGWMNRFERLDTTWTSSFPERMLALRVGDVLTDALSWSRSTRLGGIQFGTDFALQPYRITAPLPAFFGAATLPSNVELYINGIKQYSGNVPAGPFQLNTIPNINGAGNAQVVLTDALGRASTLNFPLYDTHQLLAQGLADWSGELGVVRKNYGVKSFDYGQDPVGSGSWRYGVTNSLTVEAHGETTAGLTNAGVGGSWLLGQAGVLSAAVAHSDDRGQSGSLVKLSYDWRSNRFNFLVSGTRTQGDYSDVASRYGTAPPRISAHALVGYSTDMLGNFGVSYLHLRYPGQDATRYANAYWFKPIGHTATFNFSLNQNLDKRQDRSFFVSASFALDHGINTSAGVSRNNGRDRYSVDANRSTPSDSGFGWRASLFHDPDLNGGLAELDYLGRYGRIASGINALGDSRYAYADLTGAVVWMDGHMFAARHVDDAFAVVSTDGMADVPVRLENRPIGNTDARGVLLIAPLNAYQNNQISIDPMQLPPDVHIERVKALAIPAHHSGALVRFSITPIRAATVSLVDVGNKPLPLGSEVRVHGKEDEPALVGLDGVVYLESLNEHNVLDVQTSRGACHVNFDYIKTAEGIAQIGPLVCRQEHQP